MIEGTFDGSLFGAEQPCFGCGPKHPFGFRLHFQTDGDDVVARFTPGEHHQGPPGVFHGGLIALIADEIAAWAIVSRLEKFGFTVGFEGRYKRAIRVGREVEARGRIVGEPARIVNTEAHLLQDGELCFVGKLKFAILDEKHAEKLIEGPIPEEMRRFARDRA